MQNKSSNAVLATCSFNSEEVVGTSLQMRSKIYNRLKVEINK